MLIDDGLLLIERKIREEISEKVNAVGILCKIFSRPKDLNSISEKIDRKKKENNDVDYYTEINKIQDLIGIRIITYFHEDVELLWDFFKSQYNIVNESTNKSSETNFEPQRKNMVCSLSQELKEIFQDVEHNNEAYKLVDSTFEIQFRTVLSEGWHEIDHALRYKSKNDWVSFTEESRMFNGIYATLETSDRAMKQLFDELAHKHYKQKQWEAMLRTKFRLHFVHEPLNPQIVTLLNTDATLSKNIYKCNRKSFLEKIIKSGLQFKISFDNIVFAVNYLKLDNKNISELTPENILIDFNSKLRGFVCQQ